MYVICWSGHHISLTMVPCLHLISGYVGFLYSSVKLTWPFCLVCILSGCMWGFSMLSNRTDHFECSVFPQDVCGSSLCLLQVDISILSCVLCPSLYVVFLCASIKMLWSCHLVCISSDCMWLLSMLLSSWPDHLVLSVPPQGVCGSLCFCQVDLIILPCLHFSAGMWLFTMLLSSWPNHLTLSTPP